LLAQKPTLSKNKGAFFFLIKDAIQKLTKGSAGSIVKFITIGDIQNIRITVPKIGFAKEFEKLNSLLDLITINNKQNQELIKLRDFLLPLLMNGQVKVKSEAKEQLSIAAEPQIKYGK